jgi:OOP family OmpA-OmpF porin
VQLARFDGDSAPFEAARPILAECLETVVDRARRTRGLVSRVAWASAALVLIAAAALWMISYSRWRDAVDAVRREPGLVVLDADRSLRGWNVSGMRDPLARSAGMVLAGLGVDTTRLRGSWTPYVSAQPEILLRRIERVLAPPVTARLALRGDSLVATGTAPADWIERFSATARAIAGIGAVLDGDVRVLLPADAQPFADSVTESRILFDVGSHRLGSAASATLGHVGRWLRQIESSLGASWRAQLDVIGRTDTTGSQELNRALSDDRARAVTEVLLASGIRTTVPEPRGIGTSDPIQADALDERARLNRSVSFTIRLARVRRSEDGTR